MKTTVQKKLKRMNYHGGLEGVLTGLAWTVLILGIIGFLAIWIMGAESRNAGAGFLAGAGQLVSALVVWVVLRALGEIIRLQKKAVGLNYGGKISEAEAEELYICETCGEFLPNEHWCHTCDKAVEGAASE